MGLLHVFQDKNFSGLFKDISFKLSRFTMSTESQRQLIKKKTTPAENQTAEKTEKNVRGVKKQVSFKVATDI